MAVKFLSLVFFDLKIICTVSSHVRKIVKPILNVIFRKISQKLNEMLITRSKIGFFRNQGIVTQQITSTGQFSNRTKTSSMSTLSASSRIM